MENIHQLNGVFAAAVTPLNPDFSPDFEGLIQLLRFLADRGCHGALLMGTTGEGPSFSIGERLSIFKAAAEAVKLIPNFHLLAGTGTPSLEDSVYLTRAVFDLGYAGVVVLPPYYYRKISDEGLFAWFSQFINKSVPKNGSVLGYHIPPVTGIGFSIELLSRLINSFPDQFLGIKDSSGDQAWARTLGLHFGNDLLVLNGNDSLFSLALKSQASGCITALANLISPLHRAVWDNFQAGFPDEINQNKLSKVRELFDRYPPMPPLIKQVLSREYDFPMWRVKPPLLDSNPDLVNNILAEFIAAQE
jgi:4-hydroxy-tetrahydrodipicolinate synthase